jgi:hypothetical protein
MPLNIRPHQKVEGRGDCSAHNDTDGPVPKFVGQIPHGSQGFGVESGFDFSRVIADALRVADRAHGGLRLVPVLQILAVAFNLVLVGVVIEAIRRNLLNARYAVLWLGAGFVLLVLSVHRPLLDWIALGLGVAYPPSLLFLVAFVFLLIIVLHYSLVISSHRDSIRRLGQAVARLEQVLEQIQTRESESSHDSPPDSRRSAPD